jgi:hypothetical protein
MELELWVDKSFNILLCASDGWSLHFGSDKYFGAGRSLSFSGKQPLTAYETVA